MQAEEGRPVPIEGSETLLETGMVITAIGQAPDISFTQETKEKLAELENNTLEHL